MTTRPVTRTLALLAGVAILVAACGSSTPTAAPGGPTAAPTAAATAAPGVTTAPGATVDPFASFHSDVDLEALFPDEIGGEPVQVLSMSGTEFLGDGEASPEFTAALVALGKTPADLSVAFGGVAAIGIIGFQITGAPGDRILAELLTAYEGNAGTFSDASFGGKSVKKLVSPEEGTSYIYVYQDVVFIVSGQAVTDALLNEVFSKLP